MTTTTRTAPAKPEPPADAVAQDAHWAAKMARLRARSLPEVTLTVCDDTDVKDALAEAERAERTARQAAEEDPKNKTLKAEHAAAVKALEQARAAFAAAAIELRFRALPRPVLQALLREHPPSEEDEQRGEEWNPDTFPAALISAASVDGMTLEEAQELLDAWSNAEARALEQAALAAQHQSRADLGKG